MPLPRYEDRVTRTPITVRQNGVVISAGRGTARPVPVLPPLDGRARMDQPPPSGPPHRALTTTDGVPHYHDHPAHGHDGGTSTTGLGIPPGWHRHVHSHSGDNSHDHSHAAPSPGQPDASMSSAGLASAATGGETRGLNSGDVTNADTRWMKSW